MAGYGNSKNYFNRELSWLRFNERVLSEAMDSSIPLFERLKFLSITSSNLDEFFMVRIASLKDMVHASYVKKDIAGMTPKKQLEQLYKEVHIFVDSQYSVYKELGELMQEEAGVSLIENFEALNEDEIKYIDDYFMREVYPVLTPMAVDSSRPFPVIKNKSLNIGALLKKKGKSKDEKFEFATVQVPSVLPRFVTIRQRKGNAKIVWLERIIERNLSRLFLNYDIACYAPYRIMRNADLTIEEDEAEDLLTEIEKQIKKRQWGEVIRLEIDENSDKRLVKLLKRELNVLDDDVYSISGPIDLTFLMKLYSLDGYDRFKNKVHVPEPVPELPEGCDIFAQISKGDILLHHPYQSFLPVVTFIEQAAKDQNVLAIKQTLYRVSGDSPIIKALMQAAENGKQVTVLVELKARFDEEHNIVWAKMLEKAGCHVIYGLVGLKTHSKITLIVRREKNGIRRYVHLGTGNYNDATAKIYTDLGLLTCSEQIGEDATAVFNMLSGYSEPPSWNKLTVAPLWLKAKLLKLIKREAKNASEGRDARIIGKMNALCDPDIIKALYDASQKGVKINLIVRGICCLKAGIDEISRNITVKSIVGDFLEHSRIFYFLNDGKEELYLSSADWMPRNLERRVEIMFPIEDNVLKERVKNILWVLLEDNAKSHILLSDGTYIKDTGANRICCQEIFVKEEKERNRVNDTKDKCRRFIPMMQERSNS